MRIRALLVAALLLLLLPAQSFASRRLVVVTIDGIRKSEFLLWGDGMRAWAKSVGCYVPDVTNATRGITDPNHAILWGSGDPGQCVNREGHPQDPMHAELLRKQRGLAQNQVAIVTGKNHCLENAHSDHPDYGEPYGATAILVVTESPPCMLPQLFEQGPDSLIMGAALNFIAANDVAWIGINLTMYDSRAHERGLACAGDTATYWANLEAIYREAERLIIQVLWPAIDDGNTDVLVTTDHGRHDDDVADGFLNHGHGWLPDSSGCALNCAGCRDMWAVFAGPGIIAGKIASGSYTLHDLAETMRALGGFDNPFAVGEPIEEALDPSVSVAPEVPRERAVLHMPAPNPVSERCQIAFTVPRPTVGSIRIVDASGRLVWDVSTIPLEVGTHTIDWDARDASGRRVASGVYFVLLEADGRELGRKLVVMR